MSDEEFEAFSAILKVRAISISIDICLIPHH